METLIPNPDVVLRSVDSLANLDSRKPTIWDSLPQSLFPWKLRLSLVVSLNNLLESSH